MKKFFTFIALAVFMLISAQAFSLSILLINDNGYASGRVDVIKQPLPMQDMNIPFTMQHPKEAHHR